MWLVFESLAARAHNFVDDRSGATAVTMALSAVPALMLVGMSIDYSRTISAANNLQSAADSATLQAAQMAAKGVDAGIASSAATSTFQAALANMNATPSTATVTVSTVNGVASATVSYAGTVKTLFGQMAGLPTAKVKANSTARANQPIPPAQRTTYVMSGGVWGDPQIWGNADTQMTQLECNAGGSGWYELLSDSAFQVNMSCYVGFTMSDLFGSNTAAYGFDPNAVGEYYTKGSTFLIGTHVVSFDTVLKPNTAANNPNGTYFTGFGSTLSFWDGGVTIDGVKYTPPDLNTTTSYLNGVIVGKPLNQGNLAASFPPCVGYNFNLTYSQPGYQHACDEMPYETIYASSNAAYFYVINVGPYTFQVFYRFDGGYMNIYANGAGTCGTPGGVWGAELAGIYDWNAGTDFAISGPTFKDNPFYWAKCGGSAAGSSVARLVH